MSPRGGTEEAPKLLTIRRVAMKRRGKGQRGQAAVLMALWLTGAFFALTVVGIDIGHLGTSATELQTVADIAAAAGARNLMKGGSASTAKSDATSVVAKNKVDGQSFTMSAADVHVGTYIGGVFTETSINPSAVRATPSVTVNNVVAGLVGMKTSTLPPLRVEPRLRALVQRLLREGETLSSFIVDAVEERVRSRAIEDEFIKRGLASGEKARRFGKCVPAASVVAGLRRRLDRARKAAAGKAGGKRPRAR